MTTALLFVVALIVIGAIARYNEDDRLFWKMLAAMVVAFVIADITDKAFFENNKVDSPIPQVSVTYPTVVTAAQPFVADTSSIAVSAVPKNTQPVGYTPVLETTSTKLGDIPHNARGQPFCICGNSCMCNRKIGVKPEIQDDS